jgi:hypothetical protein
MALDPVIPVWPDLPANVRALATTRAGGFSTGPYDDGRGGGGLNLGLHVGDDPAVVARNRAALAATLPGVPAYVSQVHGIGVVDAAAVDPSRAPPEADASTADRPDVVCAMMTADCLPALFADLGGKVVGAAHAGWRGLAAGVLGQTVRAMRDRGADELTVWLGPAIGPSSFEVGQEVWDAFVSPARSGPEAQLLRAAFCTLPERPGKYLADIYALARILLARDGVTRVHGGERCTVSEKERFYSYRRDGITGRQASLIWIAGH